MHFKCKLFVLLQYGAFFFCIWFDVCKSVVKKGLRNEYSDLNQLTSVLKYWLAFQNSSLKFIDHHYIYCMNVFYMQQNIE